MSIIQASIPLFFVLIATELAYARIRGLRLLTLSDSITDLSLGTLSQLFGVLFKLFTIGLYIWFADHLAVQRFSALPGWSEGRLGWSVAFVLVDLAYYWSHRFSHEVHLLWAGHVVHHSSEEYNLAVALRQSSLHGLFTWVFYIPLALMGVPSTMFVSCYAVNLVYQFWIHTRAVGRLGRIVEAVLNTPSHHRVHHGVNPKYQDRNYAGVFIVWDRLFGTFVPEEEEPVYGITHPLASWNPLWANIHEFVAIWRAARRTRGWRNRLRVVFGAPSWRPAHAADAADAADAAGAAGAAGASDAAPVASEPPFALDNSRKFDPAVSRGVSWYALAQFVVVLVASVRILAVAPQLPLAQMLALVFYVALALTNIGGLLEGERWAYLLEQARLGSLIAACGTLLVLGSLPRLAVVLALGWLALSAVWLWLVAGEAARSLFRPPHPR